MKRLYFALLAFLFLLFPLEVWAAATDLGLRNTKAGQTCVQVFANPVQGASWCFDRDANSLKRWNGSAWVDASSVVLNAADYPGADIYAKIQAAHDSADCPATGCVIDARRIVGVQALTTALTVTKSASILLGAATPTAPNSLATRITLACSSCGIIGDVGLTTLDYSAVLKKDNDFVKTPPGSYVLQGMIDMGGAVAGTPISNIWVRGIRFLGGGASGMVDRTYCTGIPAGPTLTSLDAVVISSYPYSNVSNVWIENNVFEKVFSRSVALTGGQDFKGVKDIYIRGNKFQDSCGQALNAMSGYVSGAVVTDNIFDSFDGIGIEWGGEGSLFSENILRKIAGGGYLTVSNAGHTKYNIFERNFLSDISLIGVQIGQGEAQRYQIVRGNVLQNIDGHGIVADGTNGTDEIHVNRNIIRGWGDADTPGTTWDAIRVRATSAYSTGNSSATDNIVIATGDAARKEDRGIVSVGEPGGHFFGNTCFGTLGVSCYDDYTHTPVDTSIMGNPPNMMLGPLGIGTPPTATDGALQVKSAFTNTTGTISGAKVEFRFKPASGTPTNYGIWFKTHIDWGGTPGAGSYEAFKLDVLEWAPPTGDNYVMHVTGGNGGGTEYLSLRAMGSNVARLCIMCNDPAATLDVRGIESYFGTTAGGTHLIATGGVTAGLRLRYTDNFMYVDSDKGIYLRVDGDTSIATAVTIAEDKTILVENLKTTGAATGKKVVCVDTTTGQLYASSSATECAN